jgi:hypothetical protein
MACFAIQDRIFAERQDVWPRELDHAPRETAVAARRSDRHTDVVATAELIEGATARGHGIGEGK